MLRVLGGQPNKGESVETLIKNPPPGAPVPPILPPVKGYLFLDATKFRASFAADVSEEKAAFLADLQVPWGLAALSGAISEPAWKSKPSWYLVATEDKMIPPPAQRQMAAHAGATRRRGGRQPRDLCVEGRGRGGAHCPGGERSRQGGGVSCEIKSVSTTEVHRQSPSLSPAALSI